MSQILELSGKISLGMKGRARTQFNINDGRAAIKEVNGELAEQGLIVINPIPPEPGSRGGGGKPGLTLSREPVKVGRKLRALLMLMGMCTAMANESLDQLFGGSDYAEPATYYLGLATGIAADGTITGEPSGGAYARVEITNDTSNWNTASGGGTDNKLAFTFIEATGAWGSVSKFFLSTAASGGTALCYGVLDVAKSPTTGDIPRFAAGALDIEYTDNDAA